MEKKEVLAARAVSQSTRMRGEGQRKRDAKDRRTARLKGEDKNNRQKEWKKGGQLEGRKDTGRKGGRVNRKRKTGKNKNRNPVPQSAVNPASRAHLVSNMTFVPVRYFACAWTSDLLIQHKPGCKARLWQISRNPEPLHIKGICKLCQSSNKRQNHFLFQSESQMEKMRFVTTQFTVLLF